MPNVDYIDDGARGPEPAPPPRTPGMVEIAATDPTPSATGWCPFAERLPVSHFWQGRFGYKPTAVVLHVAQGSYEGTYATFKSDKLVSTQFCVAKDGRIAQYVSVDDSAWGNGDVQNPSWPDLIQGVNPNYYTISIEHEGLYTEQWTPQMYAANLRLLQWIQSYTGLQYSRHHTLIGHFEIDSVNKSDCPGPNVEWDRMINDLNTTPVVDVARAALIAGANKFGVPLNDQTALAKYAIANHLGIPLTDEFPFTANGLNYVGQVWSQAVVYVKVGDWGNVQKTS